MQRAPSQRKRVRTIRHFAALDRLDPRFHDELHAMLLEGRVKQTEIIGWLAARGCTLSKAAMCRYRQAFLAARRRRADEQRRVEIEAARDVEDLAAYAAITADPPPHAFTEASVALCELLLFESLNRLPDGFDPEFDPELFCRYGQALCAVVGVRARLVERQAQPGPIPPKRTRRRRP